MNTFSHSFLSGFYGNWGHHFSCFQNPGTTQFSFVLKLLLSVSFFNLSGDLWLWLHIRYLIKTLLCSNTILHDDGEYRYLEGLTDFSSALFCPAPQGRNLECFLVTTFLDLFLLHQCGAVPPSMQTLLLSKLPLLSYLRYHCLSWADAGFLRCFPCNLLFIP